MRILFDQGTPAPLRYELPGHHVTTAHEMGWAQLNNGELLLQAESRFDLLITTDQDLASSAKLIRSSTSDPRTPDNGMATDKSTCQ